MTNGIIEQDITGLGQRLRSGALTVRQIAADCLGRIDASGLNAFVHVEHDQVLRYAAHLDAEAAQGNWRGPLHGVPVAVKDVIDIAGQPTRLGSSATSATPAREHARVVDALLEAGALIIGKTTTQELAYGGTGDRSAGGPARNPHDTSRITGGSSAGSSAAVAAGLVWAALGTDTGGSVRIPASLCGIIGMKPTRDLISLRGVHPLSRSMDHVGVLTRSIRDNRTVLAALADLPPATPRGESGHRVGVPRDHFQDDVDASILSRLDAARATLAERGHTVVEIDLPQAAAFYRAQRTILLAEAYQEYGDLVRSHPATVDARVRRRVLAGADVTPAELDAAHATRASSAAVFAEVFTEVEALLTATTPMTATPIHQDGADLNGRVVDVSAQLARMTAVSNLAGLPSLSVPLTGVADLPAGMQLIGPPDSEDLLYHLAETYLDEST